jgi:hypothetical protein
MVTQQTEIDPLNRPLEVEGQFAEKDATPETSLGKRPIPFKEQERTLEAAMQQADNTLAEAAARAKLETQQAKSDTRVAHEQLVQMYQTLFNETDVTKVANMTPETILEKLLTHPIHASQANLVSRMVEALPRNNRPHLN